MVLLDDTEPKAPKELSRGQKIVRWVWRIALTLVVIGGISVFMLSAVGRNESFRPVLKQGLEDFFTAFSGMTATIDTLEEVSFYPNFGFAATGISFKDGEAEKIKIDTFRYYMGFWDKFFSRERFKALDIQGLRIKAGVLVPQSLTVDRLDLSKENGLGGPGLTLRGTYGAVPFKADLAMIRETYNVTSEIFSFAPDNDVTFTIGDVSGKGLFSLDKAHGAFFHDMTIKGGDKQVQGSVAMKGELDGPHVKVNAAWGQSRMALDMGVDDTISGSITFPVFDVQDDDLFALGAVLAEALAGPKSAEKQDTTPLSLAGIDLDVDIDFKQLKYNETALGHAKVPVKIKNAKLTVGPLKGRLSDGALSGKLVLDESAAPATLTSKAELKQFDYGILEKAFYDRGNVKGRADILLDMTASGQTSDELMKALNGEAVFIAGNGEMDARAFNLWGGGLINALLPDLDPSSETTLNCAIADFKIENGIARPAPLFVDTKRVTVAGKGKIDLSQGLIDVQLKPKAKQIALLQVSPAVNIKGPLTKPSIGPDTLSLGTTLGGLLLGAVNPAFLAFSLADLGLNEQHPCYKFIDAPAETEESEKAKPAAAQAKGGDETAAPVAVEAASDSASENKGSNE